MINNHHWGRFLLRNILVRGVQVEYTLVLGYGSLGTLDGHVTFGCVHKFGLDKAFLRVYVW
jgi:hypothetical protein